MQFNAKEKKESAFDNSFNTVNGIRVHAIIPPMENFIFLWCFNTVNGIRVHAIDMGGGAGGGSSRGFNTVNGIRVHAICS